MNKEKLAYGTVGGTMKLGKSLYWVLSGKGLVNRCSRCVFGRRDMKKGCYRVACRPEERGDGQYVYFESDY